MSYEEKRFIIENVVKEAVKEVLEAELKPFFIDCKIHYRHHQLIDDLIKWSEKIKTTVVGTIVTTFIAGIIGLMILGFILWGKKNF